MSYIFNEIPTKIIYEGAPKKKKLQKINLIKSACTTYILHTLCDVQKN